MDSIIKYLFKDIKDKDVILRDIDLMVPLPMQYSCDKGGSII